MEETQVENDKCVKCGKQYAGELLQVIMHNGKAAYAHISCEKPLASQHGLKPLVSK